VSIRQTIAEQYTSGNTPVTATFGAATIAGNAILVAANGYNGGGATPPAVTDDSSNAYGQEFSSAANARTYFFLCGNIAGKASQTITMTPGASGDLFWQAWEVDSVNNAVPRATTTTFYVDADSNPNPSVTSDTPTQAGNIVFVACGTRENFGTFALTDPTSGYTRDHLDLVQSGSAISSSMAHKSGSGSAQTAAWTCNTGAPGSAGIIVLKQGTLFAGSPLLLLSGV
jgi:hypothetical protein